MNKGWQQWRELERHLHPLTVLDVMKAHVFKGRLDEANSNLPAGLFKKLWAIWCDRHRRRTYGRHIRHVNSIYKEPSKIHEAHAAGESNPLDNPFITWYSYYFDLFASHYGMPIDDFNSLPYASLHEFKLAIGARQAGESGRRSIEANLSDKGAKYLKQYPRREVSKEAYIHLMKSRDETKKHLDNHFRNRKAIYKN